jgi:hypothetical protein
MISCPQYFGTHDFGPQSIAIHISKGWYPNPHTPGKNHLYIIAICTYRDIIYASHTMHVWVSPYHPIGLGNAIHITHLIDIYGHDLIWVSQMHIIHKVECHECNACCHAYRFVYAKGLVMPKRQTYISRYKSI